MKRLLILPAVLFVGIATSAHASATMQNVAMTGRPHGGCTLTMTDRRAKIENVTITVAADGCHIAASHR